MNKFKNIILKNYWGLFTLACLVIFFVYATHLDKKPTSTEIKVNQSTIYAQIADTENKRSMGLSYTKDLATNSGMLFVFPDMGVKNFWMRDMNYDLDIIWVAADKTVSGFFEQVRADSYNKEHPEQSKIYHSPENTAYVLEVPAGTIKNLMIKVGDQLDFKY